MKGTYRAMNEQINPPEDFRQRVMGQLAGKPKHRLNLRPLAAVAAILAVVLLATPVMAAYVPPIEDLMYKISPETAARFSPIRESDEENGILMEVLAASVHGDVAEIYLRFTDTDGKSRLGETSTPYCVELLGKQTDLNGEKAEEAVYRGARGFGSTLFEEGTGHLYVMEGINYRFFSEEENRYLSVQECFGDKLTVTVNELWQDVILEEELLPVKLGNEELWTLEVERDGEGRETVLNADVQNFRPSYYVAAGVVEPWGVQTEYTLIRPGEPEKEYPGGTGVMGMVWIDGRLHVLVRNGDTEDVFIRAHLVSTSGETHYKNHDAQYTIASGKNKGSYTEYVFEIAEEELSRWAVACTVKERQVTKGPWRVTFPLVESDFEGKYHDIIPEELKGNRNGK